MNGICFILRAVPGAGKSTLAKQLAGGYGVICEADEFMLDKDGNYNFSPTRLGYCHAKCFDKFTNAIETKQSPVIQSNTNIKNQDISKYKSFAEEHGYTVFVITVENHHNNSSVHDVPEEKRIEMANILMRNIKLV